MGELVTVGIASCNNSSYIKRCVDSVLAQTYCEIEVIIVDDGSVDDTLNVLEPYDDKRIRIISKENGGLSSSRQRVLEEACGNYVCFVDADDYLSPDYIRLMYQKIKNDSADICVCGTVFLTQDGKEVTARSNGFSYDNILKTVKIRKTDLATRYCNFIATYHMSDSWNKMYRVDFLKESGVRFCIPKGMNGSDSAFNHKILLHEPIIATITERVYFHVLYSHSAVHRKNKQLLKAYQELVRQVIEECRLTQNEIVVQKQVPFLYLGGLRNSFRDVTQENKGAELHLEYERILERNRGFLKEVSIEIRNVENCSKSIAVFVLFLKMKSIVLLRLYIRVWSFLVSVNEKKSK